MIEKIYTNLLSPEDDLINNIKKITECSDLVNLENAVFVDIETTGLSSKTNQIYLIGCMYLKESQPVIHMLFCESPDDEEEVLIRFNKLIKPFSVIIEFNGDSFDIPFINKRCELLLLSSELENKHTLDLYKLIRPYAGILTLYNLKQKTIEERLGFNRKDLYSGKELINIYNNYVINRDLESLELLLLHNKEDVFYMLKIFPVTTIDYYFKGKFNNHTIKLSEGLINESDKHVIIETTLPTSLCCEFTYLKDDLFICGNGNSIRLSIKITHSALKLFFKNYKDYYYLPDEDMAIHKDASAFVDKAYRTNATASNCYIKKESDYIPVYRTSKSSSEIESAIKLFKKDYSDKTEYIEVSSINDNNIHEYLLCLLSYLK